MSNNNKKRLVPALRFPEFRNAGEWEKEALGVHLDYLQPTKYLVSSTAYKDSYSTPVLTAGKTFILGYTDETEGIFSDNLPVIIFDDFTTASKFVDFPFKAKSSAMKILVARDNTNIKFIYESMQNLQYEVGVHERHWISIFSKLKVPIPRDIKEQQKIADCMSSLDELISAHTQKHEALQSYKKGLMQNLFPIEGETVPELRFPEFRDAGGWKETPLKRVFSILQGFAFSSKDAVKKGARWLKIADVSIQNMSHKTPSFLPIEYKNLHKKYLVKKGDYVVALTRPILGGRLKVAIVDDVFNGALLNQRVGKIVAHQQSSFVYYLLQTSSLISDIEKSIAGSEPPNLSAQQIGGIRTYVPKENEQRRIADCLSSVDDLISAQAEKIEHLKNHKEGLMEKLFPAVSEMRI